MKPMKPDKQALNFLCYEEYHPEQTTIDYLVHVDTWNAFHVEDW